MEEHSHDPITLCKELQDILRWFPAVESYAKISATPLASVATTTSALTITSILIIFNARNSFIKTLAGLSLILLLFTITLSIYFLLVIFRADFRISRVRFAIETKEYMKKTAFTPNEIADLVFLTHLARHGFKAMKKIEWLYQHLLWRYFYSFISIILILILSTVLLEIGVVFE